MPPTVEDCLLLAPGCEERRADRIQHLACAADLRVAPCRGMLSRHWGVLGSLAVHAVVLLTLLGMGGLRPAHSPEQAGQLMAVELLGASALGGGLASAFDTGTGAAQVAGVVGPPRQGRDQTQSAARCSAPKATRTAQRAPRPTLQSPAHTAAEPSTVNLAGVAAQPEPLRPRAATGTALEKGPEGNVGAGMAGQSGQPRGAASGAQGIGMGLGTGAGGSGMVGAIGGTGGGTGGTGGGMVDHQPRVVEKTKPHYPEHARRLHKTGSVTLKFLVDAEGRVHQPSIIEATPAGWFEESALAAVVKWRFAPAKRQGKPVPTWLILPVRFTLEAER